MGDTGGKKSNSVGIARFYPKSVTGIYTAFCEQYDWLCKFKYVNYKKETIDWPIIALANQKQYISVYVCSIVDSEYVAEKHKQELGKVKIGRSCIRLKKLEDLNLSAFGNKLKLAAKYLGLAKQ